MGGFTPPTFEAPTMESVYADPGYQFRLRSGQEALERSAAARGTLRTGGTLRDILQYGQDLGAQEYAGVYNRALGLYDRRYQSELDRARQAWEEYVFANTPRGGGGGGRQYDDIPPPPEAPDYGPPEEDPASGPGGDPYGDPYDPYEDPYGGGKWGY